jgi:2-C-methyl-D-erythritol 4-phosphate cytidylyltransferase
VSQVHAIITAAGSSRRMDGIDKLLLPLNGLPLLVRTLEPFLSFPGLKSVVVAVNPERCSEFAELFERYFPNEEQRIIVTAGGVHRQQSILHALRELSQTAAPDDRAMIHDGARPFVGHGLFRSLLAKLTEFDGVIPALPVRDTIKKIDGGRIVNTQDRETLRLVQTPQAFQLDTILGLHEQAARDAFLGTDDASLLERYGRTVGWVDGPIHNLKVTVPEDVDLLGHLFSRSAEGVKL